jgi:hypothetical protein
MVLGISLQAGEDSFAIAAKNSPVVGIDTVSRKTADFFSSTESESVQAPRFGIARESNVE